MSSIPLIGKSQPTASPSLHVFILLSLSLRMNDNIIVCFIPRIFNVNYRYLVIQIILIDICFTESNQFHFLWFSKILCLIFRRFRALTRRRLILTMHGGSFVVALVCDCALFETITALSQSIGKHEWICNVVLFNMASIVPVCCRRTEIYWSSRGHERSS